MILPLMFQFISSILSDLQKLLRYFNGIAIDVLLKIPFTPSAKVFIMT